MTNIWDDPELMSGDYFTLSNPGDIATGTIVDMRKGKWFDENERPSVRVWLECDDGEVRHFTASYVNLAAKLREERPEIGDQLYVKYVSRDKHPKDPKKNIASFDVRVKKSSPRSVWDDTPKKAAASDDVPF